MCDTSLIEPVCDSVLPQSGIECHHCNEYKAQMHLLTSYITTLDLVTCTYVGNYAWSRPGQWSSTPLWFHKRWQYWFWVAVPVLPIHFQNDWHSCPAHCRRAIYTRLESARRKKTKFMYDTFSSFILEKKLCMFLTFLNILPLGWISFSSLITSRVPRLGCGPKRCTE